MRRIVVPGLLALVLLLAAASGPAATTPLKWPPSASHVCALARSKLRARVGLEPGVAYLTVLVQRYATRVVELSFLPNEDEGSTEREHDEIWGCWGHTHRGVLLYFKGSGQYKGRPERLDRETLRVAGTLAAFAHYEGPTAYFPEEEVPSPHVLEVVDLRSRKVVHKYENGVNLHGTRSLVLKPDGAVAVIDQGPIGLNTEPSPGGYEVDAYDARGPARLLASGPDIAPESLRLHGSLLTWTQDGRPFSATLN
jgi:hypothetical protein